MYSYTITEGSKDGSNAREGGDVLNYYLAEQIAKDRLYEARTMAAQGRLMDKARIKPEPLRVTLGLALIRLGRSLAGQAATGTTRPRRATA